MKITEEETGSNPYCTAAAAGDPQENRVWSGPPAVLQQGSLTVRRKTKKQKEITSSVDVNKKASVDVNKKDIYSETPSESHQLQRPQVDKSTKMGRNQPKKNENTQTQNTSPPPRDHNSSPAREQSWMENESDELTEKGFKRWVINFSELKEHVLMQCKETKHTEKC